MEKASQGAAASKYHKLYSKINTISKVRDFTHTKTTPLACSIFPDDKYKNLESVKWGRNNEDNALKGFHAKEGVKHIKIKLEKAGLFLHKNRAYIGASPDSIMYCKCHGKSILEAKCPNNIHNSFIREDINKCSFLSIDNGEVTINKGHKYYTQVISQIQLSQPNQGYSIVWTTKDSIIQIVGKKKKHIGKKYLLISIFFSKDLLQQGCWQSSHCNLVVLVKKHY